MSEERARWEERYRHREGSDEPEPFFLEVLPMLPRGRALDAAAGAGRHSVAMARAGIEVIAVDFAEPAMRGLLARARREGLAIHPVVADMTSFPIGAGRYDAIVNVNFLDRELFAAFRNGLRIGGMLLADTFLIDQAALGHPRNPRHLLGHWELMELLRGMEIIRYREGLTVYADGSRAWRASALAIRRG